MKGQVGNLTSFAYVLMMLAIVMGVGLVVLSQFQTVGTPTQVVTAENTTSASGTLGGSSQASDTNVLFSYANFGEFRNASLTFVSDNASKTTANTTVKVNGNTVGLAYGYNTSGTFTVAVSTSYLANGVNNVSYSTGNTTHITDTLMSFGYTRLQDLQARNTIGSVTDSFSTLVGWLPILVVIICVAIVLGLLGFGFSTAGKKQKR